MSFLKNVAAAFFEMGAESAEKQRTTAKKFLEANDDRLSAEQRAKAEAHAYSDAPEKAREIASNLREHGE